MVCSHAVSGYLLSNYILIDVNRFNRRYCDVNPEEHERLTKDFRFREVKGGITMHLTIFLKHGQTLRFENVTNLKKEYGFHYVITFSYTSMSDGQKKRGIFSTKDILGLSVNKEDFDVSSLF